MAHEEQGQAGAVSEGVESEPPKWPIEPNTIHDEIIIDTTAGEDAAAVAEAPACRVNGSIWANHDPGIDGKCRRCSFQYPKLNLRP